jgi:hypothetical protein
MNFNSASMPSVPDSVGDTFHLHGYDFHRVCALIPQRHEADGLVIEYLPQDRYVNTRGLPLNRYGAGPFCKFQIPYTYGSAGVYVLTKAQSVVYVGGDSQSY